MVCFHPIYFYSGNLKMHKNRSSAREPLLLRVGGGGGGGGAERESKMDCEHEGEDRDKMIEINEDFSFTIKRNRKSHCRHKCNKTSHNNFNISKNLKSSTSSSRLIKRLGNFLASRNVINLRDFDSTTTISNNNDNNNNNVTSRQDEVESVGKYYDKIVNSDDSISRELHQNYNIYNYYYDKQPEVLRYNQSPMGYENKNSFSRQTTNININYKSTRRRFQLLLSAILTNRKGLNKTRLFISLLRAPIVLAAIFSMILIVSLMILYTMSFHQFHCPLDQQKHHYLEMHNERDVSLENSDTAAGHSISSRHLLKIKSIDLHDEEESSHHVKKFNKMMAFKREDTIKASNEEEEEDDDDDDVEISRIQREAFERALTIQTECGTFIGDLDSSSSSIVFKDIPYASPPVGPQGRWSRPRPIWLDDKLCLPKRVKSRSNSDMRGHCSQLSPTTRRFTGSEDCLYLNIYKPIRRGFTNSGRSGGETTTRPTSKHKQASDDTYDQRLPVMVYIHGGFLSYGSSGAFDNENQDEDEQVNWMKAGPSGKLASELNVLLVAFNFRLQALGFMTLRELAQANGPFGAEGNYGLWDQLTALNWIKRNIESFGGDPNNIILFGPDSASALPLAMMSQGFALDDYQNEPPATSKAKNYPLANHPIVKQQQLKPSSRALDANQIDSARNKESKERSYSDRFHDDGDGVHNGDGDSNIGAANEKLDTHHLFRAAWLTNPSLYYELPYELANQHYQRLFLNQSPCKPSPERKLTASSKAIASESASLDGWSSTIDQKEANNAATPTQTKPTDIATDAQLLMKRTRNSTPNETFSSTLESHHKKQSVKGQPTSGDHKEQLKEPNASKLKQPLLECLMGLSGEEVARYYLGKDDPSYRLDDQNSLPIHGIFADQFVTVDQELVQLSYPSLLNHSAIWDGGSFGLDRDSSGSVQHLDDDDDDDDDDEIKSPTETSAKQRGLQNNSMEAISRPNKLASKPITPVENSSNAKPKERATARSYYNAAASNNFAKSNYPRKKKRAFNTRRKIPKLLLGSTAQAVEYWSCPRNLNQWQWDDFERYVSTGLNSFTPNTYDKAAKLYNSIPSPSPTSSNIKQQINLKGPKKTYLTMVSDIRQICPINELYQSLANPKLLQQQAQRYIVELGPSKPFPVPTGLAAVNNEDNSTAIEPEFAFHYWDLIAFFGFEFEPRFKPAKSDLEFQTKIRQMVREFVHVDNNQLSSSMIFKEDSKEPKITLFAKNGTKLEVSYYKAEECAMWRKHLGRSYAWVS